MRLHVGEAEHVESRGEEVELVLEVASKFFFLH